MKRKSPNKGSFLFRFKYKAPYEEVNDMYGYLVGSGYMGRLKDGTFRLFATENEYREYYMEV